MRNVLMLFCLLAFWSCQDETYQGPLPTGTVVKADMEEEGKSEARRLWFESLHQSAPDVDWQQVEYETSLKRHRERAEKRQYSQLRNNFDVDVANGKLKGNWTERGSSNQAGNVIATEYDAEDDILYCVSGGGSLFKGTIDGLNWEVLNQDFRFNNDFLRIIKHNGQKRMLAHINRTPHYSDDLGQTWHPSSGIPIDDRWGNVWHTVVEGSSNRIYLLSKPSYWTRLTLYTSVDGGETYEAVSELSSHDPALFKLYRVPLTDEVYFIEKYDAQQWNLSQFAYDDTQFAFSTVIDSVGFGESRANICGAVDSGKVVLYLYNSEKEVWRGNAMGTSWSRRGKFSGSPWNVGMFVSPYNPEVLLMGEVECYRSTDRGRRWAVINGWAEYYGDVFGKLHADMMYFNAFLDSQGEPFVLISNHGGISITRNDGATNANIGLYGLNVSQYYSVRTDPINRDLIYAGSQDQGFQRGAVDPSYDWVEFDQVISGDYGHTVFTNSGQTLWTVYPGGWISFYDDPHNNTWPSGGFTIDSDHESVWIPPIVPHPDPSKDIIYAAGGNINGGEGSYVIEATLNNGNVSLDQWDTDFRAKSGGGKISAICFSPLDAQRVFVAMDNGRFFYSHDGGSTWDESILNVAGGHYLYGSSIIASQKDIDVIYVSGSGYSTAPVMWSNDGGRIFRPMRDSLPGTVAFQIAANEDESMIFAATEAGPYVYIAEDDRWYDISGIVAPTQTYWSAEFLPDLNVVRFGTYGRGIWDFEIEEITTSDENIASPSIDIFPNPTSDFIRLSGLPSQTLVQIYSMDGQFILEQELGQANNQLSVQSLPKGSYLLTLPYLQISKTFQKI